MAETLGSSTIPAVFYRGGTSNALMIRKEHLPVDQSEWQPILAGALGSPDPYGRQLNGMGGGVSSLSKICVICKSPRGDVDVEYTFIQMGIRNGIMDLAGTCGNMTAAVGPFAFDEGISRPLVEEVDGERIVTIRILNTNTNKIIHARFRVEGEKPTFKSAGTYSLDGVSGTGSLITLSFITPGGSKTGKTLPTGNAVDNMTLTASKSQDSKPLTIQVSLIDVANPAVVIAASDIGIQGDILPDQLDQDKETMELLESIRTQGAIMMGLDPSTESIPKMVIVSAPQPDSGNINLVARVLSMRQTHKAIPLTIALNLGAASQIDGTLPNCLATRQQLGDSIVIGHPSGKIEVGAQMRNGNVETAVLHRTARPLMRGDVYWR